MTTMGKHKIVTCGKCLRNIRSDNVRRHMKVHEKEKFEMESLCSSSIATSRTSLQEDTESYCSSVLTSTSTPINEELLIKTMMKDADKYNRDMAVGEIVTKRLKMVKYHRIVYAANIRMH